MWNTPRLNARSLFFLNALKYACYVFGFVNERMSCIESIVLCFGEYHVPRLLLEAGRLRSCEDNLNGGNVRLRIDRFFYLMLLRFPMKSLKFGCRHPDEPSLLPSFQSLFLFPSTTNKPESIATTATT